MLGADLLAAVDPVTTFEAAGMEPDDWQARALRSRARQAAWLCSRQSGKSVCAAALAAHEAIYRPGSLTLVVAPTERQSAELVRKVRDVLAAVRSSVRETAESVTRVELANGSRVVGLPGSERTVRGFSAVDLLVLDEAARIEDALYHAVRPMLAVSGGRLIALTSAWGRRGWLYEVWTNGGQDWERELVPATMCPRIAPDFLEEERRSLPRWVFESEYMCRFAEAAGAVFREEDLQAAFDPNLKPLFGPEDEIWQHRGTT